MSGEQKFTQRLELAQARILTNDEFESLANHPHPKIRLKIAQRADTPSEILKLLANDPEENVRIFVAKHDAVLPETLNQLATDSSNKVATECARRYQTPFKALEFLANHENELVRRTLAKNIKTPRYILMNLAESDNPKSVLSRIWRRNDLSDPLLLKLTDNSDRHIRKVAYSRLEQTSEIIEKMACDDCYFIRAQAAENSLVSQLTLQRLANDSESFVRSYAASNPKISLKLLKLLSHDLDYGPRSRVAKHSLTTPKMLTHLSFDENDFVRRAVAANEKTPQDVLKKFVIDPSSFVRSNVASNKALPTAWLKENFPKQFLYDRIAHTLGHRDDPPSVYAMAHNPKTPFNELEALSRWRCDLETLKSEPYTYNEKLLNQEAFRKEAHILGGLIRNPALPSEILHQICHRVFDEAQHDVIGARNLLCSAVLHPATTQDLIDEMFKRADEINPPYPEEWGHRASDSFLYGNSHRLKNLISQNPVTSPQILRKLTEHSRTRTRAFVAKNPTTPMDALRKLAIDPEFIVKFRLIQREIIPTEIGELLLSDSVMAEIYEERLNGGYVRAA